MANPTGMRRNLLLPAALTLLLAAVLMAAAAAEAWPTPYAPAELLTTLTDPEITEASGLAASRANADVAYTMNDSGGPATVYAVDLATGETVARLRLESTGVPGVEQVDWEDMAIGPGPDGGQWIYVADIGDNPSARPFVHVLAFPEPDLADAPAEIAIGADEIEVHVLAYEDGPRDAETLLVHPETGQLTIVTKTLPRTGTGRLPVDPENGFSGIYTAPNPLEAVNLLTRQADFDLRDLVTVDGDAALWATAGDIAPDGSRVVIRTLFEAFEFEIVDGDVVAALGSTPLNVALPEVRQGESITYTADAAGLLAGSEGSDSPVHLLLPEPEGDEPPR